MAKSPLSTGPHHHLRSAHQGEREEIFKGKNDTLESKRPLGAGKGGWEKKEKSPPPLGKMEVNNGESDGGEEVL